MLAVLEMRDRMSRNIPARCPKPLGNETAVALGGSSGRRWAALGDTGQTKATFHAPSRAFQLLAARVIKALELRKLIN